MVFCSSKFELIEGENSSEREEPHLGSNLVENSVQISQVYCESLSQIRGETLGQFEKCLFPTVRLKCTFCVCVSDLSGGTNIKVVQVVFKNSSRVPVAVKHIDRSLNTPFDTHWSSQRWLIKGTPIEDLRIS